MPDHFNFDDIKNAFTDVTNTIESVNSKSFYCFIIDNKRLSHYNHSTGWKLHISFEHARLKLAIKTVLPILSCHFIKFKVIKPEEHGIDSDFYDSKQVTIYLHEDKHGNNELMRHLYHPLSMIAISLDHKAITPGNKPPSDAELMFPYFSIRNDMLFKNYLPTDKVGQHFNPVNRYNPYLFLLQSKPCQFSLIHHINKMSLDSKAHVLNALLLSSHAFLNEYLDLDNVLNEAFNNLRDVLPKITQTYNQSSIKFHQSDLLEILSFLHYLGCFCHSITGITESNDDEDILDSLDIRFYYLQPNMPYLWQHLQNKVNGLKENTHNHQGLASFEIFHRVFTLIQFQRKNINLVPTNALEQIKTIYDGFYREHAACIEELTFTLENNHTDQRHYRKTMLSWIEGFIEDKQHGDGHYHDSTTISPALA